jgi:hypothetical protein
MPEGIFSEQQKKWIRDEIKLQWETVMKNWIKEEMRIQVSKVANRD